VPRSLTAIGLLGALVFGSALPANAAETILDAVPLHDRKVRLDGLLREWPQGVNLSETVSGNVKGGDPRATAVLGYDDDAIYVAMDVDDAQFVHKKDYAELRIAFPVGRSHKSYVVKLEPGNPGKTAGSVSLGGKVIPDAKIVEAPRENGLTLEAKLPWSAFPEAKTTRIGLRGAVLYHDADGSSTVVIGTSKQQGNALPALTIQGEYALHQALISPKGLSKNPAKEVFGNLVGDRMKERVAVYDRYLTVTGFGYRGGTEFFYQDLQVQGAKQVKRLDLVDFNGDGFDELVIQRQVGQSGKSQELLEVWRFPSEGEGPRLVFQHEVGITHGTNRVVNGVELTTFKGKPALVVKAEKGEVDVATWEGVPAGGETKPVLLPWQSVRSRTFAWTERGLDVVDEATGKPLIEPPPSKGTALWSGTSAPKAYAQSNPSTSDEAGHAGETSARARPPSADELLDQVYQLYRTERGAQKLKPRFDFAVDVAKDETVERVLVHGKDIVVFGKKFLQGTSYVYTTIGVEKPEDVLQVSATDLTGDGQAELIVHGVIRARASQKLGGDLVTRHAVFIYRVLESGISRIFAAETGRAVGHDKVLGSLKFVPAGKAVRIELGPGRAIGWTKSTYPFPEDRSPYAGLEPLLLPWTEQEPRVYEYVGGKFVSR
jgi:hypothetical protein